MLPAMRFLVGTRIRGRVRQTDDKCARSAAFCTCNAMMLPRDLSFSILYSHSSRFRVVVYNSDDRYLISHRQVQTFQNPKIQKSAAAYFLAAASPSYLSSLPMLLHKPAVLLLTYGEIQRIAKSYRFTLIPRDCTRQKSSVTAHLHPELPNYGWLPRRLQHKDIIPLNPSSINKRGRFKLISVYFAVIIWTTSTLRLP